MQVGLPIYPTALETTVVDPLYVAFNNTAYTQEGALRKYLDNVYSARTNIYPLATYSWNDVSNTATSEVIRLSDKAIITPTVVPCVKDITVVYVLDTWKAGREGVVGRYFLYTGVTGNVNFTTIDPASPSNFSQINNYRHADVFPSTTSIYWEDLGAVNSKRHLDGTIYTQTDLGTTGVITNTYTLNTMIDTIMFFNMDVENIKVTVYDLANNILVPEFEIDIRDFQGIMTPYQWFFTPTTGLYKQNFLAKINPYSSAKIKIVYTNLTNSTKLGEVIFSRMLDIGRTEDAPQGRKKKFDTVEISPDGKKSKVTRPAIIDEVEYNVWINTARNDSVIQLISKLINENIAIVGDESGKVSSAIHYGWISEHPYQLDTQSDFNKYSMKITTLA